MHEDHTAYGRRRHVAEKRKEWGPEKSEPGVFDFSDSRYTELRMGPGAEVEGVYCLKEGIGARVCPRHCQLGSCVTYGTWCPRGGGFKVRHSQKPGKAEGGKREKVLSGVDDLEAELAVEPHVYLKLGRQQCRQPGGGCRLERHAEAARAQPSALVLWQHHHPLEREAAAAVEVVACNHGHRVLVKCLFKTL